MPGRPVSPGSCPWSGTRYEVRWLLAGGGHGPQHLLHAPEWVAAMTARREHGWELACLCPREYGSRAHLELARHLGGAQQRLPFAVLVGAPAGSPHGSRRTFV